VVEGVVLLGSPVSAEAGRWREVREVVAGRFVNAYSDQDWVLGLLYRLQSTSGMLRRPSGIVPVEGVSGVENVNVSRLVAGHADYLTKMGELLDSLNLDPA